MPQRDHLPHRPFPTPRTRSLPPRPAPARMEQVPPAYPGRELQGLGSSAKNPLALNLGPGPCGLLFPHPWQLVLGQGAGRIGAAGGEGICMYVLANNQIAMRRIALCRSPCCSPSPLHIVTCVPAYDRGDTSACPYDSDSVLVTATRAARPRATQPVPCPRYLGGTIISSPILVSPTNSSKPTGQ